MIYNLAFIFLVIMMNNQIAGFKQEQLKYSRVRAAYNLKENGMKTRLGLLNIDVTKVEILLRAFKKEEILEIWCKSKEDTSFQLFESYRFCSSSGQLGPKRREGDGQIPEGIYEIDRFNPSSNFYLSLGINYPNASDQVLSDKQNPGGDIFIHGNCVTIGCIPITDDKISEVYILAVEARNNGQNKIPVHLFPCRLNNENMYLLALDNKDLIDFWLQLRPIYTYFELNKRIPDFEIDTRGHYMINKLK